MKTAGNVLWVILGGFLSALLWLLAGILCCITIVGIPLGKQCFKFAKLSFLPFGKEVVFGGGAVSTVANILWLLFLGIPMAIADAVMGLLFCITIIGIPFGLQHFKLAKLALMPFGAKVRKSK
ncbi:MAG: YccF domain-containing protein [Ruminococcaceae bacterium]|nr:YccF domain-containing protein [Oscillospiraceae bacterium]